MKEGTKVTIIYVVLVLVVSVVIGFAFARGREQASRQTFIRTLKWDMCRARGEQKETCDSMLTEILLDCGFERPEIDSIIQGAESPAAVKESK